MSSPRQTPILPRRLRPVLRAVLAVVMLAGAPLQAATIPAAGDGRDVWIVIPETDRRVTVVHRRESDKPYEIRRVVQLQGRVAPGGAAAAGGRLWLAYSDNLVQSIRATTDAVEPSRIIYERPRSEHALPPGTALRSLAANATGPWALVEVHHPGTLAVLDEQGVWPPRRAPVAAPPALLDRPATPPGDELVEATTALAIQALPAPVDRLLRLGLTGWETAPLPEDWPQDGRGWLVMRRPDDRFPVLLAAPSGGSGGSGGSEDSTKAHAFMRGPEDPATGELWVYTRHADQWQRQDYRLETMGELTALSVDGQLLVARLLPTPGSLEVALWLLRPEVTAPLGKLSIKDPPSPQWAVVPEGQTVGLVNLDKLHQPTLTAMNLHGQEVLPTVVMKVQRTPTFLQDPDRLLVVGVLALAILLMLVIWRRDPASNRLELPGHYVLADLGRRGAAAIIDLAPCLALTMFLFDVRLAQLPRHWPGLSGGWSAMAPGLFAIGLFVTYTFIAELFTARTVGKAIFGLRVATLQGGRPNLWQVMARNFFKTFDLIAWYVLPILMLIGPYRQRLGDLLARTVVAAPPPEKGPPGENEE